MGLYNSELANLLLLSLSRTFCKAVLHLLHPWQDLWRTQASLPCSIRIQYSATPRLSKEQTSPAIFIESIWVYNNHTVMLPHCRSVAYIVFTSHAHITNLFQISGTVLLLWLTRINITFYVKENTSICISRQSNNPNQEFLLAAYSLLTISLLDSMHQYFQVLPDICHSAFGCLRTFSVRIVHCLWEKHHPDACYTVDMRKMDPL